MSRRLNCPAMAEPHVRDTFMIRARFSSRDDAAEACQRLEYACFAHNSISIIRIGADYELAIYTRPEDERRRSGVRWEHRKRPVAQIEHAATVSIKWLLAQFIFAIVKVKLAKWSTFAVWVRSVVGCLYEARREPATSPWACPLARYPRTHRKT